MFPQPKYPLHPNTSTQPQHPPMQPSVREAPAQAKTGPVAIPNRAQFFDNDLSEQDKQSLIDTLVSSAKAALSEPKITVNTVARLLAIEHAKVKSALSMSRSLKQFLETRGGGNASSIKRAFARMTDEERKTVLLQLQSMQV